MEKMEDKIRVIICPTDAPAWVANISNDLGTMQSIVQGYIESVPLTHGIDIICNEEGRLMGLAPNKSAPVEGMVGTVILCGVRGEDFASLDVMSCRALMASCDVRFEEKRGRL